MIIGVPKEVKDDEYRVAMTPAGVRELTSAGHTVSSSRARARARRSPTTTSSRTGATIVDDADDVWAAATWC